MAAALVALSPFMIYYSTEARGYQLAIALLLASTFCLLRAVDDDGRAGGSSTPPARALRCYTHYTAAFVLAAQACWAFWAHPARHGAA